MPTDTTPALPVVAHMWQHDETGMTGFVEDAPLNELAHWEHMNRPRKIVVALTGHKAATSALTAAQERADSMEGSMNAAITMYEAALSRAEAAERENRILQAKAANSLANNLCPDHRDKQTFKPCLACSLETLERERDALRAALVELVALTEPLMKKFVWTADKAGEVTALFSRARAAVAGVPKPILNPSLGHQAGLSIPSVRTDQDAAAKALEFAEYMAKGAEQLLEAMNAEDAERDRDDDSTEDETTEAMSDRIHEAVETRCDLANGLRRDVYEFRKRAEKATSLHAAKAGSGENE